MQIKYTFIAHCCEFYL